jgi:ribokinase
MLCAPEIVVVGSHAPALYIRVERVPVAGETVGGGELEQPLDGGKGSNQAITAARLGAKVAFVGCVGNDRMGAEGERWMRDAGVDTTWLRRSGSKPTGAGLVIRDGRGECAIITSMGANAELSRQEVEDALRGGLRDARVLLCQFEIPQGVALHAVRVARELGMITIVNPAPAPQAVEGGYENISILVPNELEARTLLGPEGQSALPPLELAKRLHSETAAWTVIVTLGERGAVGVEPSGEWRVQPPRVEAVDLQGAGDVFCAALSVALARGEIVKEAAQWACFAAALSVTRFGTVAVFPTRDEVELFRESTTALGRSGLEA